MSNKIKGYIICESASEPEIPVVVNESGTDNKRVIIKATLQDSDVMNRNKRIYPKDVLVEGLNSEYIQERLATRTWFGEAGERVACLK